MRLKEQGDNNLKIQNNIIKGFCTMFFPIFTTPLLINLFVILVLPKVCLSPSFSSINFLLVCWEFYVNYWGYSRYAYKVVTKAIRTKIPLNSMHGHGNSFRLYARHGYNLIFGWLTSLRRNMADFNPTRAIAYLPPNVNRKDAYLAFAYDMKHAGENDIPGCSFFYKIWRQQFATLKTVRKNRLGVCDECVKMDSKYNSATSFAIKKQWADIKAAHLLQVNKGIFILLFFL